MQNILTWDGGDPGNAFTSTFNPPSPSAPAASFSSTLPKLVSLTRSRSVVQACFLHAAFTCSILFNSSVNMNVSMCGKIDFHYWPPTDGRSLTSSGLIVDLHVDHVCDWKKFQCLIFLLIQTKYVILSVLWIHGKLHPNDVAGVGVCWQSQPFDLTVTTPNTSTKPDQKITAICLKSHETPVMQGCRAETVL